MTEATGEMPEFLRRAAAPPADPPPAREPRQRRTNRRAAAPETAPEKPARAPRKPRAAKKETKERAAPETIKVTLKEYAVMRVGEDNAKAFLKAHTALMGIVKSSRAKVLDELQKVLG